MAIKAFVFDCGGVVLRDGDASAYAGWEQRLGLLSGELRDRLYRSEAWALAERGKLTEGQYWGRVGAELGLNQDADVLALCTDLWRAWEVDSQVLDVIDHLRPNYRVAMLSNATDALEAMLDQRYHIADRFDPILNSARLGVAKPEPAIYEEMLKRLELNAGEVLFVDDRAENIAAAAALGVHVIWFVQAEELVRQLRPYLRATDKETLVTTRTPLA